MVAHINDRAAERALIARWISGDMAAFNDVVGTYRASIYARALNIVRNEQDAAEMTNDCFLAAHKHIATFRGDSSLHTWLTCIVTRKALNRFHYWRRRRRDQSVAIDTPINEDGATYANVIPDHSPGPVARLNLVEDIHGIAEAIQSLSESDRTLVIERSQGATYEELAARHGLKFGTVKSRLSRCRAKVNEFMAAR